MNNIEMRQCVVQVNEDTTIKGLFYKWVKVDYPMYEVAGLVEIETGKVVYVHPELITFIDSEYYFNQFDWRVVEPVDLGQTQEDVVPEGMYKVESVDTSDDAAEEIDNER